jgi:hypothetical protein
MGTLGIFDCIIILTIIQAGLSVLTLLFGFKTKEPEEEFKPVEFDWKQEGF